MIKFFLLGMVGFILYTLYNDESSFNQVTNSMSQRIGGVVREIEYSMMPILDDNDWGQDSGSELYAVVKIESGYVPVGWVQGENQCYLAAMAMAKRLRKENSFKYDCCTYFDGDRCRSAL